MVPEIEDLLAWLSALPSNPTAQLKREGSSAARCAAAVRFVDYITWKLTALVTLPWSNAVRFPAETWIEAELEDAENLR